MKAKLTESQIQALRDLREGLTRPECAATAASLERRALIRGDWMTGYYLTEAGKDALGERG